MNKIIGENIKRYREIKNLSQEYLGEVLEMTQSAFAKYEAGISKLRLDQAHSLAALFGVTIDDLMTDRYGMVGEGLPATSYQPSQRSKASIILELDGTMRAEESAINLVRQISQTLKAASAV